MSCLSESTLGSGWADGGRGGGVIGVPTVSSGGEIPSSRDRKRRRRARAKGWPGELTAEVRLRATEAGKDQEMSAGICVYGGEEGVRFGCQSLSVCVRVISDQPSSPRPVRVRQSLPPSDSIGSCTRRERT